MKQIRKQLAALLLAVALAAACAAPAFAAATAASIELTRKGSITVTLRDSESGSAVSGGRLTLYQVASISRHLHTAGLVQPTPNKRPKSGSTDVSVGGVGAE